MNESKLGEVKPYKQKILFGDFERERKDKEIMKNAVSQEKMRIYAEQRKKRNYDKNILKKTSLNSSNYVREKAEKEDDIKNKEEKKFEIIWVLHVPISGDRDQYGDLIDDTISLGDDGIFRINEKDETSEEQIIKYVKRYLVEKKAQEEIKEIEKCKKKIKKII